jgi:hypothetical protein
MAQLDLFGTRRPLSSVPQKPNVDKIRMQLSAALEQLRAAHDMPWTAVQLNSWHHVFHNMTKWLPSEERDSFCRNFESEVSRLGNPLPLLKASAQ